MSLNLLVIACAILGLCAIAFIVARRALAARESAPPAEVLPPPVSFASDADRKRLRQQIDTTPNKKITFVDFNAFMRGTGWSISASSA